jgi:CHAD domain-containing protein
MTFGPFLPSEVQAYRDELKWLGAALGEVRDLDVQLEWLGDARDASGWEEGTALGPLIEELSVRRDVAREKLLAVLQSERYRTLLSGLTGALRLGPDPGAPAEAIRAFAAAVLKKDYRKFRRQADGLQPDSEPELYHATRIRGKRLRYALEALQPVFERNDGDIVQTMRSIQDLLGDMQDCSVSIALLRDLVSSRGASWPPATLVRAGELIEQRRSRAAFLRERWPDAWREGRKQWKRQRRAMRRSAARSASSASKDAAASDPPRQGRFAFFRRFFARQNDH